MRVAGIISLRVGAKILNCKGNFTYSLGKNTREGIAGADRVHGYKEMITVPMIEGQITDTSDLDFDDLSDITNSTVTLDLASGKIIVLESAWFCNPDGFSGQTEEGEIEVKFEGLSATVTPSL